MYKKRKTDKQHLVLQFNTVKNYSGAVKIQDTKAIILEEGFWFEFTIQPTPLSREYRVLLIYINGYAPSAYILGPNIVGIADQRDVPHLYSQSKQKLCLTYPSYNEWRKWMPIADTYIPWIALWLFYYEEWVYSNEWKGGGRHPGDEAEYGEEPPTSNEEKPRSTKQRKIDALKAKEEQRVKYKKEKIYKKRKEVFLSTIEKEAA